MSSAECKDLGCSASAAVAEDHESEDLEVEDQDAPAQQAPYSRQGLFQFWDAEVSSEGGPEQRLVPL